MMSSSVPHQQQPQRVRSAPNTPKGSKLSSRPRRSKRVSKDEKISILKSDLKVSREENARLKKELERLASGDNATATANNAPPVMLNEQEKKFRQAMRAMKKVTVSQEMCIRTLRTKAKERRKDLKQRDARILELEHQTKRLEGAASLLLKQKSLTPDQQEEEDLPSKLQQLQMDYNSLLQRNNDLEEILDEKEAKMGALQKQRNSLLSPLHNHNTTANNSNKRASSIKGDSDTESAESGSYQSISTAGDFDMARLKTELAQKSEKILKLQMDLDMVKEERYQLKQQNKRRSIHHHNHEQEEPSSSFAQDPFSFASDPFGMMGSTSHSQRTGDDWTDVEDTDNESEFGEAPFDQQRQQFGAQQGAFGESFFTTTSSSTSKLHASTALSTTAAEPDFW